MSRFVRASKYRHIFAENPKKEQTYQELRISKSAWDSNMISANPYFFAVNWNAGGGGAFMVNRHDNYGKIGATAPLYTGHTSHVLDTAFNPFNDFIIASASEDCLVKVWSVPEAGLTENCDTPLLTLSGHGRKVGQVKWHPTAANVLASVSTDLTTRLWNVETAQEVIRLEGHTNNINDLSWNEDGSQFVTVGKDKKMKVWDPRSNSCAIDAGSHEGIKGSRCEWILNRGQVFSTGFSKTSSREYALWDLRNTENALEKATIDSSSGVIMTFYDSDSGVLYLAGKGDGNIRYYEIINEAPYVCLLSEYKSPVPQKGMGCVGKRIIDVSKCEIMRLLKLTNDTLEPLSFCVPRKAESFAEDLYPDTPGGTPALTAEEWFGGRNATPILVSLRGGFVRTAAADLNLTDAARATATAPKSPADMNEAELREALFAANNEMDALRRRVAALETELRQAKNE